MDQYSRGLAFLMDSLAKLGGVDQILEEDKAAYLAKTGAKSARALARSPEYRAVYIYRFKKAPQTARIFAHFLIAIVGKRDEVLISCDDIGGGFVIHHGMSTIVSAIRIGRNFAVSQGVTIGDKDGIPTIGDNVYVGPSAIVIGKITIGNGCIVGAQSLAVRDVPDGMTVYGSPSHHFGEHRASSAATGPGGLNSTQQ